jgi:3-hydroxyacyl-[acyl-carrier-protein] dehydratase
MEPAKKPVRSSTPLCGAAVVQLLLPHRPPFLFVDVVTRCEPGKRIEASRYVTANERCFEGHFEGFPIWPGVYTQEGMGQTANLLEVLTALDAGFRAARPDVSGLELVKNLDRAFRLDPAAKHDEADALLEVLRREAGMRAIGMGAAVDVKLVGPVFPGCRLDYVAERGAAHGELVRFEVEAQVEGKLVAKGTLTSRVRGFRLPGAGA